MARVQWMTDRRNATRQVSLVATFLVLLVPAGAADLKNETVKVWDDYIQAVNLRLRDQVNTGGPFLWVDESPERVAKVRRGEIVVSPAGAHTPKEVPSGLIHDWIGAVFIANATCDQVQSVVRDYGRYKDIYRPAVIDSRPVKLSDAEDRFSLLLANKSLFRKTALDSDYRSSQFQVDHRRRYAVVQTIRIREIAEYGETSQRTLPEDQGTGLIWRLFGVTRLEEREGGVYLEIEAIVLSRDVPASLRWFVDPVIRRVAKSSLVNSLQQTRDAVNSSSTPANRTVAARR
jgi:hypothetical protein